MQAEGREESESDEEEVVEEAAEAFAMEAAAGDGAQVVSTEDATVQANGNLGFLLLAIPLGRNPGIAMKAAAS